MEKPQGGGICSTPSSVPAAGKQACHPAQHKTYALQKLTRFVLIILPRTRTSTISIPPPRFISLQNAYVARCCVLRVATTFFLYGSLTPSCAILVAVL